MNHLICEIAILVLLLVVVFLLFEICFIKKETSLILRDRADWDAIIEDHLEGMLRYEEWLVSDLIKVEEDRDRLKEINEELKNSFGSICDNSR